VSIKLSQQKHTPFFSSPREIIPPAALLQHSFLYLVHVRERDPTPAQVLFPRPPIYASSLQRLFFTSITSTKFHGNALSCSSSSVEDLQPHPLPRSIQASRSEVASGRLPWLAMSPPRLYPCQSPVPPRRPPPHLAIGVVPQAATTSVRDNSGSYATCSTGPTRRPRTYRHSKKYL
jgi:hypothetical protein